jgi:hypothetical protein
MATKINTDYYGAENTWIINNSTGTAGQIKTSPYTIGELVRNGTYTGGDFEHTASPWGVGESSISSMWHGVLAKDGNKLVKRQYHNDRGNTPLYLYENSDGSNAYDLGGGEDYGLQANITCRISPAITVPELQGVNSTLTIDNNTNVACCGIRTARPITYYNYQDSRLLIDVVWFVRENGSLNSIEHAYLADFLVNPQNYRNIKYVLGCTLQGRFKYGTQGTLPTYGDYNAFCPSVGGNALKIPETYKKSYYGDEYDTYTRPQRRHMSLGYWRLSSRWSTSTIGNASDFPNIATVETLSATPYTNLMFTPFGQLSEKNQVFDDVSYHWKYDVAYAQGTPYVSGLTFIEDGDALPNLNVNYYTFCHLEIDNSTYEEPALAYVYALIHEAAFMGFPVIVNAYDSTYPLNWDWIFLPEFDEHLITTGDFIKASQGSEYINYTWGDVFGQTMPEYDPDYEPPKPTPEEDDTGNLNNFPTYQNRYANPNSVYALDESNFNNFVSDVNNMYLTDTDDIRMKLDFKGSNPNEYIIGVYGIPFLCNYVVPSGGDQPINLGPVTLPTAKGKKVDTSTTLMRDCGTVTIPQKGNFLDYEPYTQIELYIPMCGTIQLDCAQVIGRTLHVIVYYDVTTMACVGCVYRDASEGETLIHTINGTIGASLPLTSARMGDYQNSVQTTKNALKQNEMRTALGLGGAAIGIAGAALAPETGGLSLALAGAAIGGIATAAGGAMTEKQLQYDLTHKQPALSQCSAADGMTAQLVSDLRPWLFIKRAKKLESYDAATYGKTVGFACCINSTVGAFSGFTVYSNADLSGIPATKTEIDMIRAKLNNGIYI